LEGDGAMSNATEKVLKKTEPTGEDPVSKKIAEEKHLAELSSDKERDSSERDKVFQDISNHVENLIDKMKKNGAKPKAQSSTAKMPGLQVSLSTAQAKTMDSIEDYWTRLEAGAVLSGPFAAGKTIVACTILWKHRLSGPQLLVCSPASMVSASSVI
jgi:RecG-like helicase